MWKEIYRLGVEKIDQQHMQLFTMTENLIQTIKNSDMDNYKQQCKQAIGFLKNYSIEHFADEEQYQKSIQYSGFTAHRKLHQEFAADVLKHEAKMVASDFDAEDVETFIGMLTAWLAYHVADADQKIMRDKNPQQTLMQCFYTAICYSLDKMAHLNKKDISKLDDAQCFAGDVAVSAALAGDVTATVQYIFTNEFVFKLFKSFLFMTPKCIDSLCRSILLEIVNTMNKNAAFELSAVNVYCTPQPPKLEPSFFSPQHFFVLHTPIGKLQLGILM